MVSSYSAMGSIRLRQITSCFTVFGPKFIRFEERVEAVTIDHFLFTMTSKIVVDLRA